MLRTKRHVAVLFLLGVGVTTLTPQTVDTAILGRGTDPQGSAVPKATVTVTEDSTGVARTANTGTEGSVRQHSGEGVGHQPAGTFVLQSAANPR